jgi:beta-phosphoglucomutase-like phosphatase (HAD superfamily)
LSLRSGDIGRIALEIVPLPQSFAGHVLGIVRVASLVCRQGFVVALSVVFDCDGVLVDAEPVHCVAYVRALRGAGTTFHYGAAWQREHDRFFLGADDAIGFADYLTAPEHDADLRAIDPTARAPLSPDDPLISRLVARKTLDFRALAEQGAVPAFDDALQLVEKLRGSASLYVNSSSPSEQMAQVLKLAGFDPAFPTAHRICGDGTRPPKPDPASYIEAAELAIHDGGAARTVLAGVEDSPTGMQALAAARDSRGTPLYAIRIGLARKGVTAAELQNAGATLTTSRLDAPSVIAALGRHISGHAVA